MRNNNNNNNNNNNYKYKYRSSREEAAVQDDDHLQHLQITIKLNKLVSLGLITY